MTQGFVNPIPLPLPVNKGGTGAQASTDARTNLGVGYATQGEMKTATSTSTVVSPGTQQYHPGVTKVWLYFNGTGTVSIYASYNVSSLIDNGVGFYTINFITPFASNTYAYQWQSQASNGSVFDERIGGGNLSITTSSIQIKTYQTPNNATFDCEWNNFAAWGATMKNYIVKKNDGTISIVKPIPDVPQEIIIRDIKKIPGYLSHREIDDSTIPADRYFRDAWVDDDIKIKVNMPKAREIHMNHLRRIRAEILPKLDVDYLEADELNDSLTKKEIAAKKKALRDMPQTYDLTTAKTPEELKAMIPDYLK